MPKKSNDTLAALGWFFADIFKAIIGGFGKILGIGLAAALFGGAGGGIYAAVYGQPIIGFAIGGAVLAAVVVFAFVLFAVMDR
ncbi:MAG: hypothetical protein ABJF50_19190 [Paracoccaceae bacterium]